MHKKSPDIAFGKKIIALVWHTHTRSEKNRDNLIYFPKCADELRFRRIIRIFYNNCGEKRDEAFQGRVLRLEFRLIPPLRISSMI